MQMTEMLHSFWFILIIIEIFNDVSLKSTGKENLVVLIYFKFFVDAWGLCSFHSRRMLLMFGLVWTINLRVGVCEISDGGLALFLFHNTNPKCCKVSANQTP